ncbi:MAG: hypothetical protein M3Y42_14175 [Actinomycetota bacterium]|nr:hypothetical protein [Actinomycetota bacterium]MDQ2958098.1 hypothetical protein [Actinomycetota bacterium]
MGDTSWFEGNNSPGAGDMGQVQALQHNLATVAEAAATAKTDLNGLKNKTDDAVWRGKSADEFKSHIDKLPGELDQLHTSYQTAADGFSSYITAVNAIKQQVTSLATRVRTAQSNYESAVQALQNWIAAHPGEASYSHGSATAPAYGEGGCYTAVHHPKPATPASGSTPAKPAPAETGPSFDSVQSQVDSSWSAMQGLYNQMHELKTHDRSNADNAVVGKLNKAHDQGMQNESFWHKFFHALAEVGKWAGIIIAAVAIVAVLVLAFPEDLGLALAVSVVTDTTFGLGAAVVYGTAIASGIAVIGGLGERATGDGPSWTSIGLSAFGMIPGLGKAGELLGDALPAARGMVSGLTGLADTLRLTPALAAEKVPILGKYVTSYLLGLGANIPVDTAAGRAIWFALKGHSASGLIPPGTVDPGALKGPSDKDVQSLISQLQTTDPAKAASAKATAANLAKGDKASHSYPKQYTYPAAATP